VERASRECRRLWRKTDDSSLEPLRDQGRSGQVIFTGVKPALGDGDLESKADFAGSAVLASGTNGKSYSTVTDAMGAGPDRDGPGNLHGSRRPMDASPRGGATPPTRARRSPLPTSPAAKIRYRTVCPSDRRGELT